MQLHTQRKFATKVQMILTDVAGDNMRPYATQWKWKYNYFSMQVALHYTRQSFKLA